MQALAKGVFHGWIHRFVNPYADAIDWLKKRRNPD